MNLKKIIIIILSIGLIIGFWFWYKLNHKYDVKKTEFEITSDIQFIPEHIDNVVLQNNFSHWAWKLYLRIFKYDARLKSGKYAIESDTISRSEIIKKLLRGPQKKQTIDLTFIEGWRNDDYITYLKERGIRIEDVIKTSTVQDVRAQFDFFDTIPASVGLQGFLFPDTYEVYADATEEEIMYLLLKNFGKKLTQEMRDELIATERNLYDVIILASIIEKEVRTLESKRNVSGIFYNRLNIGMALQSDATVNYITQSGRDRSTLEDLEIDSLYNTYKYKGLPPGPIANPGFDSIYAAIFPAQTKNYYFLTTRDGRIYYAKTFNEHVKNKIKYLK